MAGTWYAKWRRGFFFFGIIQPRVCYHLILQLKTPTFRYPTPLHLKKEDIINMCVFQIYQYVCAYTVPVCLYVCQTSSFSVCLFGCLPPSLSLSLSLCLSLFLSSPNSLIFSTFTIFFEEMSKIQIDRY